MKKILQEMKEELGYRLYWMRLDIRDFFYFLFHKKRDIEKTEYMAMVDGLWECPTCTYTQPFGGQLHHYADGREEWLSGGEPIRLCPRCNREEYIVAVTEKNKEFWSKEENRQWAKEIREGLLDVREI